MLQMHGAYKVCALSELMYIDMFYDTIILWNALYYLYRSGTSCIMVDLKRQWMFNICCVLEHLKRHMYQMSMIT